MKYAVVITYSFDNEVTVYVFETVESAQDFLRKTYLEELRIDTEENGRNSTGEISDDSWYAKITTEFDDITEFRIGSIYP